jgi:RNA polymerase sigma factor (sigma-70 family)
MLAKMSDGDLELLARYTGQNAEDAFAEIVRRHLGLVFSAALRQVRSPQLAEEVAQSVFTDLARQADGLAPDTILSAWLYRVTHRAAIDVVRRESRRQAREQAGLESANMNTDTAATDWTQIERLLDEAMQGLDEADRTAVLLRYFENQSFREVGEKLGTSEDAARKRISRAVERLREFFAGRGVAMGSGGLATVLSANAVQAAPGGLAAVITAGALSGKTAAAVTAATTAKAVGMTAKGGTMVKGAATLGALGSMFAMLGGVFVTLRAQADNTKSPRERRFVLQMIGVRIVATVVALTALACYSKLDWAGRPVAHQALSAGFIFVLVASATVLFDYSSRRQREIQMEDGTWVEAEWKLPKRDTGWWLNPDADRQARGKYFKAAKFMAFGVALTLVMAAGGPWKDDPGKAMVLSAGLALAFWLSLRQWLRRPRFDTLRIGWVGVLWCGMTLLHYNILAFAGGLGAPVGGSLTVVVAFNLIVVFVYAAFIGVFAWMRKSWSAQEAQPQSTPLP